MGPSLAEKTFTVRQRCLLSMPPPMSCPSNILLSAFDGSSALVTFLSSPKQKQSRDEVGDQFGSSRRGLLASEAGEV